MGIKSPRRLFLYGLEEGADEFLALYWAGGGQDAGSSASSYTTVLPFSLGPQFPHLSNTLLNSSTLPTPFEWALLLCGLGSASIFN